VFVCSVSDFATMYAGKLGVKTDLLARTMWGDYFLNSKAKRIFKKAQVRRGSLTKTCEMLDVDNAVRISL